MRSARERLPGSVGPRSVSLFLERGVTTRWPERESNPRHADFQASQADPSRSCFRSVKDCPLRSCDRPIDHRASARTLEYRGDVRLFVRCATDSPNSCKILHQPGGLRGGAQHERTEPQVFGGVGACRWRMRWRVNSAFVGSPAASGRLPGAAHRYWHACSTSSAAGHQRASTATARQCTAAGGTPNPCRNSIRPFRGDQARELHVASAAIESESRIHRIAGCRIYTHPACQAGSGSTDQRPGAPQFYWQ
jgi:hypothetical protein